uniref:Uncharacterized protein n=1 Tax=Kalanchoe fedtschenkoi TaxID=63787 RepID=A0A7N0VKX7_KALFE
MFGGRKRSIRNFDILACKSIYSKKSTGMAFESDWTRDRLSSTTTAQVIRPATCFMPWSCRIPIGDSYHEFL